MDSLKRLGGGIRGLFGAQANEAAGKTGATGDVVSTNANAAPDGDTLTNMLDKGGQIGNAALGGVKSAGKTVTPMVKESIPILTDLMKGVNEALVPLLREVLKALGPILTDLCKEGAKALCGAIGEGLGSAVEGGVEGLV